MPAYAERYQNHTHRRNNALCPTSINHLTIRSRTVPIVLCWTLALRLLPPAPFLPLPLTARPPLPLPDMSANPYTRMSQAAFLFFFCRVHEWKAPLALPVSHPCRLRLKNPVKNARFPGASRAQPTLKTAHTRPSSPTKIRGPQAHSAKTNDCATPVAMMRIRFKLQAIQNSQPGSSSLARLPAAESHAAMDRSADGFCRLWRSTSGPGASASGLRSCTND